MGIEISYGIIFIGNGELSVADFAQYVERHKICSEYMAQSEAYLSGMRERIDLIRKEETQTDNLRTKKSFDFTFRSSTKFLQYENRYKTMVKEKKISPENVTRQINIYFQNTYEIVVLMRYAIRELRMNMNDIIAEEVRGVDQEGHQKKYFY